MAVPREIPVLVLVLLGMALPARAREEPVKTQAKPPVKAPVSTKAPSKAPEKKPAPTPLQPPVTVDRADTALGGYDAVAYFTHGRPVKGVAQYSSSVHGVRYRFSSARHKAAFDAEPAFFLPLFGGYCVMGVAGQRFLDGEPEVFRIAEGRLVFFSGRVAAQKFDQDPEGVLAAADAGWKVLLEKRRR